MATERLGRTLSIFNNSTRRWTPILSTSTQKQAAQRLPPSLRISDTTLTQRLSLTTWNIDAFSSRAVSRARLILSSLLDGPKPPDILFLQEVTLEVRTSLLDDARVRAAFLVTDAEDQVSFRDVPFATMTLLSSARFASGLESPKEGDGMNEGANFMIGGVSRVTLPSNYGRDALLVDIISPSAPDTVFGFINVHLDSLADTLHYRARQLEILTKVLRRTGCGGGIIAGDFNAISPADELLLEQNELVDAWLVLYGRENRDGDTWGFGLSRQDRFGPGRLDKVAMMDLEAEEMEVLCSGAIEVPRPGKEPIQIPWSDHSGLRCTFTV